MTDLVSVRGLLGLAADSVRAPRPTFARLLALGIPRQVLWEALILVVVVSVILAELGNMILRATIGADGEAPQFLSPFAFGALQFVVLVTSALLTLLVLPAIFAWFAGPAQAVPQADG